jgi:cyclopropane fatty-acyl-phospholipid synthase-like methyltransferase
MLRHRLLDRALSHRLLPDAALLAGSRIAMRARLRSERTGGVEAQEDRLRSLVWHMSRGPIAEAPSHDLLLRFQDDLVVADRWAVSGTHYARTLRAWLERLDANSEQALAVLERAMNRREARRQLAAWRLFMISTAELWGWRDGNEWLVSHYLLAPRL